MHKKYIASLICIWAVWMVCALLARITSFSVFSLVSIIMSVYMFLHVVGVMTNIQKAAVDELPKVAREVDSLKCFILECPECASSREDWVIDIRSKPDPPIDPRTNYHIVRYRCIECDEVFKKVEEI